jgi:hypothetical protein
MAEKEIALFREQMGWLSDKKFDPEAWKSPMGTGSEAIFGKECLLVKMIRELKFLP